jgi:ribonuclease Z
MHCTTDEAISIGKRMNAKYILLTHFSQKWAKVPEFVLEWSEKRHGNDKKYENVGIAFDHMVVKVGEMWKLPMMMDAFEVMYADERERKTFLKRKYAQTKGRMGGDDGEKLMTKKRKRQMELLEDHIEVVRNVQ